MQQRFRIVFREEMKQLVNEFSKVHQYDDRKDFKEAWEEWCEEHCEELTAEMEYQMTKNITIDIDTLCSKLYVSARYYHRKLPIVKNNNDSIPKKKRVQYIKLCKDFLDIVKEHCEYDLQYGVGKPSSGFEEFCEEHSIQLWEEIDRLRNEFDMSKNQCMEKIKKTYKNIYYNTRKNEE